MNTQNLMEKGASGPLIKRRNVTPLRIALARSGLTQRALAQASGLNETLVSLIVNGHWNPDSVQKIKIAEALGVSVNEVFPD